MSKDNSQNLSPLSIDQLTPLLTVPGNVFVYWKDLNGNYQGCNPLLASTLGFDSVTSFIGINDNDLPVLKKEIDLYKSEDKKVIKYRHQHIFKETVTTKSKALKALVYKFPLFDQKNIIGIFGFAYFNNIYDSMLSEKSVFSINGINISKKEDLILHNLVRGHTAKEIAEILCLSSRTIETNIENLKIKFQAKNKSKLIRIVFEYYSCI